MSVSSPLSEDAVQLSALLVALTQPNTEAIRSAEATLKPILKDVRSVSPLMEVLSARNTQVRLCLCSYTVYVGS